MASVSSVTSAQENPNPWVSLWRLMTRFDSAKLAPWIALRTTIGISFSLALAWSVGNPAAGTVAATGAMNVSFSDGSDPYFRRAGRMLAASFCGSIAVFIGALISHNDVLAITVATAWAFMAGMLISVSSAAADIGLISLVTLVVFTARPMRLDEAAFSGV